MCVCVSVREGRTDKKKIRERAALTERETHRLRKEKERERETDRF